MTDRFTQGGSFLPHGRRTDRQAGPPPSFSEGHQLQYSYRRPTASYHPFPAARPNYHQYPPHTPHTIQGTSFHQLQDPFSQPPGMPLEQTHLPPTSSPSRWHEAFSVASTGGNHHSQSEPSDEPIENGTTTFIVNLRELEYVEPFDQNLVCPICQCPFVQPVRLGCDHIFCVECLQSTFEHQSGMPKSCPHCRSTTSPFTSEPPNRLIERMLDDLAARCPLQSKGCNETIARSLVQDHVNRYCQFHEIICPDARCNLKIQRGKMKEVRCYHGPVVCACSPHPMMEVEFEEHRCENRRRECPDCHESVHPRYAERHANICSEKVRFCEAAIYGCTFVGKYYSMDKHKDCCQLRMLGPHLEFQQKRLKECVTFMDRLRRQNDQFRQFTVAVEEILDLDPLDPTQHTRASNAHQTVPSRAQTNRTTPDPVMDHLVSLTERLRGEVGRVTQVNSTLHGEIAGVRTTMQEEFARLQENTARSLAEIEARYDMQILDASVRYDQDIAQANASIASLRGQIQWLVNRVTNTQRAATVRAQNAGNDGPSISRRAEAIAASQSGGPSQSGAVSSPDPPERRLSDSSRQDPKL